MGMFSKDAAVKQAAIDGMWAEFNKFVAGEESFFYLVLQPISHRPGRVHHYETLLRSKDGLNKAMGPLFSKGNLASYRALTTANIAFIETQVDKVPDPIAFNLPSYLLGDLDYIKEVAARLEKIKDSVIVEISEKAPDSELKFFTFDEEMFKSGIQVLKDHNLYVSLDDVSVVLPRLFEKVYPHTVEAARTIAHIVDEFKLDMQDVIAGFQQNNAPQPHYKKKQEEMKNTEAMARAVDAAADFAEEMLQNGKTVVLEWSIQELMGSLNPLAKLMRNSRYDSQLLIQGHATGDWGVDTMGLDRLYTHRAETEAGAAAKAEAAPAEAGAAEAPRKM